MMKLTNEQLRDVVKMIKKGERIRISESLLREVMLRRNKSGMTLTEFCRRHDLKYFRTDQLMRGINKFLNPLMIDICNILGIKISNHD